MSQGWRVSLQTRLGRFDSFAACQFQTSPLKDTLRGNPDDYQERRNRSRSPSIRRASPAQASRVLFVERNPATRRRRQSERVSQSRNRPTLHSSRRARRDADPSTPARFQPPTRLNPSRPPAGMYPTPKGIHLVPIPPPHFRKHGLAALAQ